MGAFINDSIRLSKESQEKFKKGKKEAFDLINRPQKKFEQSIMVGGGVCSQGLTNLILLEGTLNEFAYAQVLYFCTFCISSFKYFFLFFIFLRNIIFTIIKLKN